MKIGLVGYFGWGNFGDELFFDILKKLFESHQITLFHDPIKGCLLENVDNLIDSVDVIVIGGGDLLIPWYRSWLYWDERYLSKPVFIYGIGVPTWNKIDKNVVDYYREFFSHKNVKMISCRDIESVEWIENVMNFKDKSILYFPDIVSAFSFDEGYKNSKNISLILRRQPEYHSEVLLKIYNEVSELGLNFKLIVLGTGSTQHDDIEAVQKLFPECDPIIKGTTKDLIAELRDSRVIISMKFHGVVAAYFSKIPFVALSKADKFVSFCKQTENEHLLSTWNDESAVTAFRSALEGDVNFNNRLDLIALGKEGLQKLKSEVLSIDQNTIYVRKQMNLQSDLYSTVEESFKIKKGFLDSYLQHIGLSDLSEIETVEDIHKNIQPQKMYVEFALTTITRGIQNAEIILNEAEKIGRSFTKGRFFDVGTAYGGFCVAFHLKGFDPFGIEISKPWYELGVKNLSDYGIKNQILHGDFLDPNLNLSELGKFDVITCNDVIEHVNDPILAISRISELLKPEGVAFFEIPNAKSINHVTKDGHYNLFGINLLPHHSAASFLHQMTNSSGYGCGEFYDLDFYLNSLKNNGFKAKVLDRHKICHIREVPSLIHKLSNQFTWSLNNELNKIDVFLRDELITKYLQYMSDLYADYKIALKTQNYDSFELKYLMSFWSVIAYKD